MGKRVRRNYSILTEYDLYAIIETIMTSKSYDRFHYGPFLRFRDAAINYLLFYTGCRPNELLHIKWSQVDFEKRLIYITAYSNKERNETPVVITKPALECLLIYRKDFEAAKVQSEYVFPSIYTRKSVTVDCIGKKINQIFSEAGINPVKYYNACGNPIYAHSLYSYRRSFATRAYNKTSDVFKVQKLLRLTRLTSIPCYVIMNDENRLKVADEVFV